ncbi:prenyltransferase/squalene oxidase repeat-containing protein [Kitasatospora brasiliensis]|uniref:prenyltransferase/squalene oxidase repeat-containing protein n=1 Tax=Kitasatospora brasiliensis TaxID=3058040 RepID=UPI002931630C|nr:prenyltransferase/squalene oxidase repeat-containing protein [Kitasatospora sp. K002]
MPVHRHRPTGWRRGTAAPAAATALTAGSLALAALPATAHADPMEQCTATSGAVVAVDFGPFGGGVLRGCDAHPTTGMNLLHNAGFATTGTAHDGPGFICRLGNTEFNGGTQYPTPDKEACVNTPQATGYWSYWIAPAGQDTWKYATLGAMSQKPGPGEVEAWVYGGTDIGGTSGAPTFSPASVRATGGASPSPSGGATPTPTGTPTTTPTGTPKPPQGDLPAAARWLIGRLTDGDHVVDPDWGTLDHAATANTALALAAAGGHDDTLRKLVAYLAAHTGEFAFPAGADAAPDVRGAALLALVAEVTGGNPSDFGGHDLIAALSSHLCEAPGRGGACAAAGDFEGASWPVNQTLGLLALARAGVAVPQSAVDRLLSAQCADGGFSPVYVGPREPCDADPGTSAMASLALRRTGTAADRTGRSDAWILSRQLPDGALPVDPTSGAGDSYTTALAAQALRQAGRAQARTAAIGWLAARQLPDGGFGTDPTATQSAGYVTEQAVLALAGTDLAELTHDITTPQPGGRMPDLAKGGAYLTDPARLLDGHYYESVPGTGFGDFGLTIDAGFALAATGTDDAALRRLADFFDRGGKDGGGRGVNEWTGAGTEFAGGGSIGKAALFAEVTGRNPRAFAGQDLIAALAAMVCTERGRAPDTACADRGNYRYATSVFSQSLGIMAQLRAGDAAHAAEAVRYLSGLQHPDGSWPSLIPATGDSDVDSTAIAAMALDLLTDDPNAKQAVDRAVTWIAGKQLADGGFPGAAGDSTNSAALAVQALSLRAGKYGTAIARARDFLTGQQNPDGGFNVAAGGQPGSDVRASTQVLGGVVGTSFGTLSRPVEAGTPEPGGSPSPSGSPKPSPSPTGIEGSHPATLPPAGSDDGAAPVINDGNDGKVGNSGNAGHAGPSGPTGSDLARTGTEASTLALLALALLLTGGAAVGIRRARTNPGRHQ